MTDWYFAPRYYVVPVSDGAIHGVAVEVGKVWGRGMFLGVDLGFGLGREDADLEWTVDVPDVDNGNGYYYDFESDEYSYYGYKREKFSKKGRRIYSMRGIGINFGNVYDLPAELQLVYGLSVGFWDERDTKFGGPFLKLRWRYLELSYRGLVGSGSADLYNHHQLMLGLDFATSKRAGLN
jgi:hypothetical protein